MIKSVLMLSLSLLSLSQAEIPFSGLIFAEKMAFVLCDSDKMVGLTWMEVEKCEERFADILTFQNISVPTWEDFRSADLNGDGTLTMEEWEEWSNKDPDP